MRLARKLILAVGVAIVAVVLAFGVSAVQGDMRAYDERVADDAATNAHAISLWLERVARDGGREAADALLAQRNEGSRVKMRWLALDRVQGDKRATELSPSMVDELRQGRPVRLIRGAWPSQELVVYRPFAGQEPVHDMTEAIESLAPFQRRVEQRVISIVLESLAILIVAVGGASMLGLRLVGRPVEQLVQQARRIGAGDLSQRLRLFSHDELSELAAEMNLMCDRLVAARIGIADEHAAKLAAVEQLRHADRLKTVGQLASGVAHEIGTPLNVVNGRAKLILSPDATREEIAHSARVIVEQSERIDGIVRQLLDFARRGRPNLTVGDLGQVVSRTIKMLAHLAKQKEVEIVFGEAEAATVKMDENQMQQVVTNLVLNGIQAMPKGGPIRVGLGREGEWVRLDVADQGTGIAADDLLRIFEPFFTTKDVGEGTGLGLSVCHGIVQQHGGRISVESDIGRGTRFSVFLPVVT